MCGYLPVYIRLDYYKHQCTSDVKLLVLQVLLGNEEMSLEQLQLNTHCQLEEIKKMQIIIRYNSGVKLIIIIASCKHKNNLQKAHKNKYRF